MIIICAAASGGMEINMRKFVRLICIIAAVCSLSLCFISCGEDTPKSKAYFDASSSNTGSGTGIKTMFIEREVNSMKADDFVPSKEKSDYVLIKIKDYGSVVVLLRRDVAPETVANFKKLVSEKFYDGTVFHRVIDGFMIQGGGMVVSKPADGENQSVLTDKNAASIKGEFSSNGFENNLYHVRGVISMARTPEPNSASSQFFIIHKDGASSAGLNGSYAAFGYVLAGMEVVDAIATCEVDDADSQSPRPIVDIVIESVIFAEPK